MPKRIQLSRKKGWRLPPGTINVARPTRWGNPFKVVPQTGGPIHVDDPEDRKADQYNCPTAEMAVACYQSRLFSLAFVNDLRIALSDLRGHDLACWCEPEQPCHADVLLKVVNDPRAEPLKTIHEGQEIVIMGELSKVDRIPDTLGWGSFEFSHLDNIGGGVYHSGFGPVYSLAVLDLCAGREAL